MKKTIKKYLSLMLVMLMLASVFAVSASAACNHEGGYPSADPQYYIDVNATCTEWGYTIYHCSKCGAKNVFTGPKTDEPLGHKVDVNKPVYVPFDINGNENTALAENEIAGYHRYYDCERVVSGIACDYREYEMTGNEKTVYYEVSFVNHRATASYDASVTYTNVADTFKDVVMYTYFVKEGEDAALGEGVSEPYHEKTTAYAQYNFLGWSTEKTEPLYLENDETAVRDEKIAEISRALENISANTTFYPVFEGVTKSLTSGNGKISHEVDIYIYNQDNNLIKGTVTQEIPHGEAPLYGVDGMLYANPTKAGNIVESYNFTGWKMGANGDESNPISTNDLIDNNKTKVYGDVAFFPCFETVAKNYTVECYDYNGRLMTFTAEGVGIKYSAVFNGLHLRQNAFTNEQNGNAIMAFNNNSSNMLRPENEDYIYEWTGQWKLQGTNTIVDLSNLSIAATDYTVALDQYGNTIYVDADGTPYTIETDAEGKPVRYYITYRIDGANVTKEFFPQFNAEGQVIAFADAQGNTSDLHIEQQKIIKITPVYNQKKRVYDLVVKMLVPSDEDMDYYLGEAEVQILDANGQVVRIGKTDANGEFKCQVNHSLPLVVSIATADDKYLGENQVVYLMPDSVTVCRVDMTLNPDYGQHCSCICHNALLRPIWVRILNILYNLFNVKYVCCYDMYSNLGSMLDYTK